MNQYIIDNSASNYFGISCYEIEHYESESHNEAWVKVVFDFVPSFGNIQEVKTWFKASELILA